MPSSLVRVLASSLVLVAAAVPAAAQASSPQSPSETVSTALMPPAWLQAFAVSAGTVQSLELRVADPDVAVAVVLGGRPHVLELQPFEVRSPWFQLLVRTAAGTVPIAPPPSDTFRGQLRGESGSAVAATIRGASVRAYVRRADGSLWIVQPLADAVAGAPPTAHAVFRGADGVPAGGHCGVAGVAPPPPSGLGAPDTLYVCDLALEADHPLFQRNGSSVAATQSDVLGIVNAVDLIFRNDVQVSLAVSQLVVDTAPDGYTTSVAPALLSQFQAWWNSNHGAIPRDLAHLFTDRPLGANSNGTIGYAYVGEVCDLANGYGVSQTHWTANFAYRVALTAHEIGHGFDATHCDAQAQCNVMCSFIGGCSGVTGTLGPAERAQILAFRQNATCLAAQQTAPFVASASPVQIATVDPPLVTLAGHGFVGATAVTVGSTVVATGLQVIGDTQLRFTPPVGLPLGVHPVSVTNALGTSNTAVLVYTGSIPCRVLVPAAVAGGTSMSWSMGGWPNDLGLLGVSFQGTTSPFLGGSLLDGFLLLWSGVLDARGMASLALPVPPGILNGFTVYSQLLDVITGSNTLRSVSSTPGTAITW